MPINYLPGEPNSQGQAVSWTHWKRHTVMVCSIFHVLKKQLHSSNPDNSTGLLLREQSDYPDWGC